MHLFCEDNLFMTEKTILRAVGLTKDVHQKRLPVHQALKMLLHYIMLIHPF